MFYFITDSYGTRQRCWTRAEALDWLRYCSPVAEVRNIFGFVIASRIQREAA